MYSMPHPLDRKYQQETYDKIKQSQQKYIIVQGPTGSGKTAWAAQLAADGYRVLALVKTKSLQAQYVEQYGFTLLYGKNNYPCLRQKEIDDELLVSSKSDYQAPTADLCQLNQKDYIKYCRNRCPYPEARRRFINARAGVLNYSKFLLDKKLVQDFGPDVIVLDECHELSDIAVNYSGLEIQWSKWIREYIQPVVINAPQQIAFSRGRDFLQQFYKNLLDNKPVHPSQGGSPKKYKFWENWIRRLQTTFELLQPSYWYITSDQERFTCKPLTARFDFQELFNQAPKMVMMSATVGQPRYFIRELGIENGEYKFIDVPNIWPNVMRPIYDYNSVKITGKSTYQERKEHAQVIASIFNKYPDWNGIVHVTSKRMSQELGQWLIDMTGRNVWTPLNGLGTEEALEQWREFNKWNEGAIACTWQFYAGVDMPDVAINISARVPYPDFKDPFSSARFKFDPGVARVRVANSLEQQQGRNRRGHAEHYGPGARKYNAIVDSKWSKLRSALNKDFLGSIK